MILRWSPFLCLDGTVAIVMCSRKWLKISMGKDLDIMQVKGGPKRANQNDNENEK